MGQKVNPHGLRVGVIQDWDAKWIADLVKLGIVGSSFIPSKNFRILRELTRYVY